MADSDVLKTPDELAEQLKVKPRTLLDWRSTGRGPKFIRVGRAVRYRESDIDDWLRSQESSDGSK